MVYTIITICCRRATYTKYFLIISAYKIPIYKNNYMYLKFKSTKKKKITHKFLMKRVTQRCDND